MFSKVFAESRLFNTLHSCITAEWPNWWCILSILVTFSLCCCHFYNLLWKGSACFDRPEHWMSVVCLVRLFCNNCRITSNFLRGLNDKQATPDSFPYLGGDVKRLVYTPLAPDFYKSKITQPHPFLIVLGNFLTTFWRLEQLFVVLATSSKFCLSAQLLSKI